MFRYLLQSLLAITVISLGVVLSTGYAGPQASPWGADDTSVETTEPAQQPEQPAADAATNSTQPAGQQPAPEATQQVADEQPVDQAQQPAQQPGEQANNTASTPEGTKPPDIDKSTKTDAVPAGKTLVGRVVWVKGNFVASSIDDSSGSKRELTKTSNIYLHDTLVTDEKSTAQVIFTDNSSVTFRPKTTFTVKEYHYVENKDKTKEEKASSKYVMDLVTGGFRTVTGLVAKDSPDNYKVVTPVATIGVRGTEYSIVYQKGQELYIQRYQGDPCVTNDGSGATTLCLDDKRKYGAVEGKDKAPVVLMAQPEVFKFDVQVVPVSFGKSTASVTPVSGDSGSGTGSTSGGSSGGTTTSPLSAPGSGSGGGIGFCIQ